MDSLLFAISIALPVLILSVFLRLASRVKQLRDNQLIEPRQHAVRQYYQYKELGDKENAYKSLLYIVYFDVYRNDYNVNDRKEAYEKAHKKFAAKFEELGKPFPARHE